MVIRIWLMVFGMVIVLIVMRFLSEKCRFMLNISSIMLILVSWLVSVWLVMKLGVNGFM